MAKQKRSKRNEPRHAPRAGAPRGEVTEARAGGRSTAWYFVRGWPALVVIACVAVWFATKSGQLVAVAASLGTLVWLAVALGTLGAQVKPRDNQRPGAIDFGKRN